MNDAEIDRDMEDAIREREEDERRYHEESMYEEGSCVDVTSMDYDWNNDVLCTRADGSQFYTSYEGASEFLGGR